MNMIGSMQGGLGLHVGDPLPPVEAKAQIFVPGAGRWHALWVAPQREDQVESWLKLRGVYGFHPVLMRKTRRHGVVREYHRRYLPGYVFAWFKGDPIQHRVMSCPWIMGALSRSNGEWGALERASMRSIHSMRKIDVARKVTAAAIQARKRADAAIRAGDKVLFRAGPFAGFEAEVVQLVAEGGATVAFKLFSREAVISTSADDLLPLRKAS